MGNNKPLDMIPDKVGANGTPINKLTPTEKKELKVILNKIRNIDHNISNSLLLRAHISSGEPINQKLKTADIISNALDIKDILKNTKKLSEKKVILDASGLFQAVYDYIKQSKSNKLIKTIIGNTLKWKEWVESLQSQLSDKTENNILTLMSELATIIPSPKNLNDKTVKKYKLLLHPLLEILFWLAAESKFYKTYYLSLEVINNIIRKYPSWIVNDLLNENQLSQYSDTFKNNILRETQKQILTGDAELLKNMHGILRDIQFIELEAPFRDKLKDIWKNQGVTLSEDMQSLIKNILFQEPISQSTYEISETAASGSIRQLATALIASWDARNDGPLANDSFNLLLSVANKYFNIEIGGDVGSITNFRKDIHEPHKNMTMLEGSEIILMRPWVERDGPQKKEIIIKAIVKASN